MRLTSGSQSFLVAVVDTATPAVTAAVAEVTGGGVTVLAAGTTVDARAHGELLSPLLAGALTEAGVSPSQLAAVVAGLGPGPFTGLRVGLVTATALADPLGVPTYGVCTLDALAYCSAGVTLAVTDARRREVYWAAYAGGERIAGPAVDRPATVAGLLPGLGAVRAVGEGARRYADVLGLPVAEPAYPPPQALAALAADRVRARAPAERLTPLYLRRPDAVEPAERKRVLA